MGERGSFRGWSENPEQGNPHVLTPSCSPPFLRESAPVQLPRLYTMPSVGAFLIPLGCSHLQGSHTPSQRPRFPETMRQAGRKCRRKHGVEGQLMTGLMRLETESGPFLPWMRKASSYFLFEAFDKKSLERLLAKQAWGILVASYTKAVRSAYTAKEK